MEYIILLLNNVFAFFDRIIGWAIAEVYDLIITVSSSSVLDAEVVQQFSNRISILLSIFVLPEYQGKGIGKQIIQTLEQDEYFVRAKRIEIPASITAVEFYKKMGYDYKNGIAELDDEQLYRLEKYR